MWQSWCGGVEESGGDGCSHGCVRCTSLEEAYHTYIDVLFSYDNKVI